MDNYKETAEHATIVDLIRNDLSGDGDRSGLSAIVIVASALKPIRDLSSDKPEICGVLPDDYPSHIGDVILPFVTSRLTETPNPRRWILLKKRKIMSVDFIRA